MQEVGPRLLNCQTHLILLHPWHLTSLTLTLPAEHRCTKPTSVHKSLFKPLLSAIEGFPSLFSACS